MRGMNFWTAIYYYITSMLPAWIFLLIIIFSKSLISCKELVIVSLIMTGFLCILLCFLNNKIKSASLHGTESNDKFKSDDIANINDGFINFIISFTAPNLIVSININNIYVILIAHIVFHMVIFILYYNSSTIIPNIMLLVLGYQLYNFKNSFWVISKNKSLRNFVQEIHVKRMGNYLYVHLSEGEQHENKN